MNLAQALQALDAIQKKHEAAQLAAKIAHEVGRRYELQVVDYHARTFGETVWHNEVIPEEELFQCGFIHDFNKHRLLRLAAKAESQGRIRYRDYGMDFLSKDINGVYFAGQAKYRSRGTISANDLGTFLMVVDHRLRSIGHLYTSVHLEINLKEDIMNSQGKLVHHRLGLTPQPQLDDTMEINYELRPFQKDAVAAICNGASEASDRKALEIFCGGGKTLITGHSLRQRNDATIICIAPLKMSVDQLRTRLTPFLPNHKSLLVDSDTGGTTDVADVREAIASESLLVIFSTFMSA